jgi:hypothetical protein
MLTSPQITKLSDAVQPLPPQAQMQQLHLRTVATCW